VIATGAAPTNCTSQTAAVDITSVANPTVYTLSGSSICASAPNTGTINLSNSQTGVSYQLKDASNNNVQTSKAGTTGTALTWTGLAAGTGYYVIATGAAPTNCTSQTAAVNITSVANPTVYTLSGSSICASAPNTGTINLSNSQTGVRYQLKDASNNNVQTSKAGTTGTALTWTGLAAGTGYYVIATGTAPTNCTSQTAAVNIIENILPTATITGSLSACVSTTLAAGTDATSANYVWYKDNVEISGQTVSTLIVTASGSYKVKVKNVTSGCEQTSVALTVTISPLPSVYSVTGGGIYCSTAVAIGLSGSQTGVNYQLYLGATPVGTAVAGTGSAISFTPQTTLGTYTVKAIGSGSCENNMRGNAVISADTEAPVANCKSNVSLVLDANGQVNITPSMIDNGSTDNCGIASRSVSPEILSCTGSSGTTYTKDIVSANGYTVHISIAKIWIEPATTNCTVGGYNYTIGYNYSISFSGTGIPSALDNFDIVIGCDQTMYGELPETQGTGTNYTNSQYRSQADCATVTPDNINCSVVNIRIQGPGISYQTVTLDKVTGGGSNIVTLTVTDFSGNSSTCQANVTLVDNTAPVLTDLSAKSKSLGCVTRPVSGGYVVNDIGISTSDYSDNCTPSANLTRQYKIVHGSSTLVNYGDDADGDASGYAFPEGISTIYYRIIDQSNNISIERSFNVEFWYMPGLSGIQMN
jgi:hypothetical protein